MAFGEKFLTLLNGYDKYINMNASLENTENKNAPSEPIQTQFDNGWIHKYLFLEKRRTIFRLFQAKQTSNHLH